MKKRLIATEIDMEPEILAETRKEDITYRKPVGKKARIQNSRKLQ